MKNQMGSYPVGQDIMFTTFVSSTDTEKVAFDWAKEGGAKGTVFIMDNSAETPSRPRNIMEYSVFPDEREYLYTVGAEFRVTKVEEREGTRVVHLELLKTCKLCGSL